MKMNNQKKIGETSDLFGIGIDIDGNYVLVVLDYSMFLWH